MTLIEWLNQFNNNKGSDYSSLLNSGLVSPVTSPEWSFVGNPGDSGQQPGYSLTPDAQQRLAGYSVNQVSQDPNNTYFDVLGSGGSKVGNVSNPIDKNSWLDNLGYSGLPVLALAGMGLFGPGGVLGGGAEAGAASAVTPEMLAAANATADPIAALNASAGWTGVDQAYLASIGAANSAPGSVQGALNDLTQTSQASSSAPSSVQGALNDLVQQSQLPAGYFAAPGVNAALGDLVGMSIPTSAQAAAAAEAASAAGGGLLGGSLANGSGAFVGEGTASGVPAWDSAATNAGVVVPGAALPAASAASSVADWLKGNGSWLAPLIGAGVGLLGGEPKSSGGYTDSGYRPTINRGGWSPSATKAPTVTPNIGLLDIPKNGVENSGLWRFLNR